MTAEGAVLAITVSIFVIFGGQTLWYRHRLNLDLRKPTWAELTKGGLTLEHRGPVIAFRASGTPGGDMPSTTDSATFVAIDESAIVAVQSRPFPFRPYRVWYLRENTAEIVVSPAYLGTAFTCSAFGLRLVCRASRSQDIVEKMRALGWNVVECEAV